MVTMHAKKNRQVQKSFFVLIPEGVDKVFKNMLLLLFDNSAGVKQETGVVYHGQDDVNRSVIKLIFYFKLI